MKPNDPGDMKSSATQTVDLADVQLLASDRPPASPGSELSSDAPGSRRLAPPPLPPGTVGLSSEESVAPVEMSVAPVPPASPGPPQAQGRSSAFYGVILLVCLVVSVALGALVTMSMRKPAPAAEAPSAAPSAAPAAPRVITISTVHVGDEPDGG